jgi:hypothetical protein
MSILYCDLGSEEEIIREIRKLPEHIAPTAAALERSFEKNSIK